MGFLAKLLGKSEKQRTLLDEMHDIVIKGLRSYAVQNNCAPTGKTSDKKIIEIYTKVATAFRQAANQRSEVISAGTLNCIVLYFLQCYEMMGDEMVDSHLEHEIEQYLKSGLRPDYQREIHLLSFGKNEKETIGREEIEVLSELTESMRGKEGCDTDEIPDGYGEFGLEVTNPVPVKGILANEIYLGRLITEYGEKITWERTGSYGSENIDNPIDGYAIFDKSGKQIATIYISPYHQKISNKVPRGFKFSDKLDGDVNEDSTLQSYSTNSLRELIYSLLPAKDRICPRCDAPTKLMIGRNEPFLSCSTYPMDKWVSEVNSEILKSAVKIVNLPCKICGGKVVAIRDGYGIYFPGCSNFPSCEYVESWKGLDKRIKNQSQNKD